MEQGCRIQSTDGWPLTITSAHIRELLGVSYRTWMRLKPELTVPALNDQRGRPLWARDAILDAHRTGTLFRPVAYRGRPSTRRVRKAQSSAA